MKLYDDWDAKRGIGGASAGATVATLTESTTPYGRTALDAELGRLARAVDGSRNDALNTAAFRLGQLVAGGEIDEADAMLGLVDVARRIGLGAAEITATARSGLNAGMAHPRNARTPADVRWDVPGPVVPAAPAAAVSEAQATGGEVVSDDALSSWEPVDLGPYLRGEVEPAMPSLGIVRNDGMRLIYPGKEHSVIGEMESGKSWWCAGCVAAELTAGNAVLYVHFEESNPTDTVGRLVALGVSVDIIGDRDRFRFVGPDVPVSTLALERLADPAPSLVVLDGVNEAMSLHGQAIRDEDGAAAFRRLLVKPWTARGAAVLSADHVVKDRERRDRGPLGSVHKGNGLTGSLILLENAEPFGRGRRGRSLVYVTKDRPGQLRQHGRTDKRPGVTFMGTLIVDDTREHLSYLDLAFIAPADDDEPDATATPTTTQAEQDDTTVLDVVTRLHASGIEVTGRRVRAKTPGMSHERRDNALARLVMAGDLATAPGPKRSTVYTPTSGSGPEDQSSELSTDTS